MPESILVHKKDTKIPSHNDNNLRSFRCASYALKMMDEVNDVVSFTIGTIHTCNIFDIIIIVVMSEMHVRIMCRCITLNVVVSQLSLVEARVTHVRANNEHSTRPKRV